MDISRLLGDLCNGGIFALVMGIFDSRAILIACCIFKSAVEIVPWASPVPLEGRTGRSMTFVILGISTISGDFVGPP